MTQYKGYYIDKVVFNSKADIDEFLKEQAVRSYVSAVEMFSIHPDMEHSIYADEKANVLHEQYGFTWEEIEDLEIKALK